MRRTLLPLAPAALLAACSAAGPGPSAPLGGPSDLGAGFQAAFQAESADSTRTDGYLDLSEQDEPVTVTVMDIIAAAQVQKALPGLLTDVVMYVENEGKAQGLL